MHLRQEANPADSSTVRSRTAQRRPVLRAAFELQTPGHGRVLVVAVGLCVVRHDIVVIGASAGGVPALEQLVAGLPAGLGASIFVVLHVSPWHKSMLPEILTRKG